MTGRDHTPDLFGAMLLTIVAVLALLTIFGGMPL